MEEPYTKREEDSFRKDVIIRLERIETQTSKTNGRVTKLENWRWLIAGGIAVVVVVVIPLLVYVNSLEIQQVQAQLTTNNRK